MLEKHPDGRYPCTLPGAKSHMAAAGQHGWRGAVRGLSLRFGRRGCGCGHVDRAGHSRALGSNQEAAGPRELYSWTQRTSLCGQQPSARLGQSGFVTAPRMRYRDPSLWQRPEGSMST